VISIRFLLVILAANQKILTPAGVGLGLASGKDAECAVALIIMIIAAFAAVSSII
tara:strand:- start:234 stop:398 length:165 start_codon:yes stop_codon:yes gene_type:complete